MRDSNDRDAAASEFIQSRMDAILQAESETGVRRPVQSVAAVKWFHDARIDLQGGVIMRYWESRERCIAAFTPLAAYIARRITYAVDLADAMSACTLGLVKGIDYYDERTGHAMAAYLGRAIRNQGRRWATNYLHMPPSAAEARASIRYELGVSSGIVAEATAKTIRRRDFSAASIEKIAHRERSAFLAEDVAAREPDDDSAVREWLDTLFDRLREALPASSHPDATLRRWRQGVEMRLAGWKDCEIAEAWGVSKQRAAQIFARIEQVSEGMIPELFSEDQA